MNLSGTPVISIVSNTIMNGLGTEGKWYEFNFDYKNIDRHLVMGGIQTASSAAGSLVNDPATSKALSTFVQGSLMTLYDYSRGKSLQDSYLNNMNWNGMMVNMSDLGNQMGQMMRAGMQNDKAKHENEQAGAKTSNANHDPFSMADTMLGGILLSLGGALGQTQRQITDKIAGSALGSAVGDLYSGSMLDTAVSGVSKGFSATRDYINGSIETVKGWGTDLAESGMNLFKYGQFDTNDSKDVQMAIMREQGSKMWESGEMDQEIMKNQSYRLWESGDMNRLVLAKYAKDVVENFQSDSKSETNAKIQAIKDIGIDTAMLDQWVGAKRAEIAYQKALKEQQAAQNKESTLDMSYKDQIKMAVDNFSFEKFGNGVKQGTSNVVSGIKNLGKAAYKMATDSDYRDRAGSGLASLYDQQSALFNELGGEKYFDYVIDNVNQYREAANRAFLEDPGTKLGNLIGEEVATVGMGKFLKGSTAALKFQLTHASRVGIIDPDTAALLGKLERKVAGQGATEGSVWSKKPFPRGVDIEDALGHNLPKNYPTIDKFENGIATSIKSLDTNAKSYQNINNLERTVTRYIDKAKDFNGRTWAGRRIRPQDINSRALDLAIPTNASS